jgi:ribosome-binding protein aMBF1 (putative translation factor)
MKDAVKPKFKFKELSVDWGELRAQASKRGLALSEFQQQENQRKLRSGKKGAAANCDQLQTGSTEGDRMQSPAEIHPHSVSEFTKHVGDLCTRREIDIDRLAQRLTMDPAELLKMINGRLTPTNVALSGLARELDTDLRYLQKLADEVHLGDQPEE